MALSPERSPDEATIMQRQVYRAGQTQPVDVPRPSVGTRRGVSKATTSKHTSRRKRTLLALGVLGLLLLLGSICYYLCLPDLEEIARDRRAILDDPNLTWEQKREKVREIDSKLTPAQARQVFQNDFKKFHHQRNADMQKFLKMSRGEQVAYVKKQEEERKRGGPGGPVLVGGGAAIKGGDGGGARMVSGGGPDTARGGRAVRVGGGGGRYVFFGPGGGPGSGPLNPGQIQKTMLDNLSPETRAGMSYQRGLSR
jgi:hypothetical protein